MSNSRLKKHLQQAAARNIAFALLGIVALVFVLVQFGPQLLINFSLMVDKLKGDKEYASSTSASFVSPPTLDSIPSATNSANITISGYSLPKQKIGLYVNGHLTDETKVKEDKSFTFDNVELKPGENDIRTKATTDSSSKSDYSTLIKIYYADKPPSLDVDSPSEGQSLSKDQSPLKVSGKTDPANKVTVNGFWAILDDEGKFSYTLPLQNGENKIKIEATDEAGNKTTKEIKITYSP